MLSDVFVQEELENFSYFLSSGLPFVSPIEFNSVGIDHNIGSLKLSFPVGINEPNSKVLKHMKIICSKIFFLLFLRAISTSTIPNDWKTRNIVPVF